MARARKRPETALRITRVYTKTGDAGTTGLVGGQRVKKNDPRIEAYGTVDELAVALGHARAALGPLPARRATGAKAAALTGRLGLLDGQLVYLQNLLFTLGGDLATRIEDRWPNMPLIEPPQIAYLEKLIDAYNDELPPLTDFILPSGGPLALWLHTARVVCRRAERRMQTLADAEPVGPHVIPFANRLSDLLFVLARWAAHAMIGLGLAEAETIWRRDLPEPPVHGE